VLEQWATWCPPCRSSIPHLNSLAQKYGKHGAVFIGITNETDLSKLNKFISSMGNKMTYRVAMDPNESMNYYTEKYDVRGIPHAFIIDHLGRVRWSGHPMATDLDSTLESLANELKAYKEQSQATVSLSNKSTEELNNMSTKELLTAMKNAGISDKGCVEKSDLVAKIQGRTTL